MVKGCCSTRATTVESLLSDPLGGVTIRSDNRSVSSLKIRTIEVPLDHWWPCLLLSELYIPFSAVWLPQILI